MRKLLVVFVVFALLITFAVPALAAKPDVPPGQAKKVEKVEKVKIEKETRKEEQKMKENGAVKYDFFLSGDVMPVPPYGGSDIVGSDEMSKLIVNQPNGNIVANVTGIMKGLEPNIEYKVFIGNGYVPYTDLEIDLVGEYILEYYISDLNGNKYPHQLVVTEQFEDGTFIGTGIGINDGAIEIITGLLTDYDMTLHSMYVNTIGDPTGYYYDSEIEIADDGTMEGSWIDSNAVTGIVISEGIVKITSTEGNTGYPGYLDSQVLPVFTFMTDDEGHASWHINIPIEAVNCEEGLEEFSIWINKGGSTILISETVVLECECILEVEE